MKHPLCAPRLDRIVLVLCVLTLSLRAVAPQTSQRTWGLDLIRFLPALSGSTYAIMGAVILVAAYILLSGVRRLPASRIAKSTWFYLVISLGLAFLFWSLRDATHLLGDGGRSLLAAARHDPVLTTEPLAQGLNRLVVSALSALSVPPIAALEAWSCGLGGAAVFITLLGSGFLVADPLRRLVFSGLVLVTGGAQLWCGYIESYPFFYLAVCSYLLAAIGYFAGRISIAWITLLLAIAISSHASGVFLLLPAHAYAVAHECRRSGSFLTPILASILVILATWLAVAMALDPVWPGIAAGGGGG